MDGTTYVFLAAGAAALWFVTSLRRWLTMIDAGRDLRAGSVSAPLPKRIGLRLVVWGLAGLLLGSLLGLIPEHGALALLGGGIGGLLGVLLGLASCVELPAQSLCGRLRDEVGASLLAGVLAAMSLVALRLLLQNVMAWRMGADISDAWGAGIQDFAQILTANARPNSPVQLLTYPPFLGAVGLAFGLVHLNRLTNHSFGSLSALCVGTLAAAGLASIPSISLGALVLLALPLALLFLGLFEVCGHWERLIWPHRTPLAERPRSREPSDEGVVQPPCGVGGSQPA